jgi:hypothetical protein
VSLLALATLGLASGQLHTARFVAAIAFAALLVALSLGVLQARKQAQRDEADAALEADFVRLERELAVHERAHGSSAGDEGGS